jgi:hypothetical protein
VTTYLQINVQTTREAQAIDTRLRMWEIDHSSPLPARKGGYVMALELRGPVTRETVRRLLGTVPPCKEVDFPGAPSLLRGVLFSEIEV